GPVYGRRPQNHQLQLLRRLQTQLLAGELAAPVRRERPGSVSRPDGPAVDTGTHRRQGAEVDETAGPGLGAPQRLEQVCRPEDVCPVILLLRVCTRQRGQVNDDVRTTYGPRERVCVLQRTLYPLHSARGQPPHVARLPDEGAHRLTQPAERLHDMGPHEPRRARDEHRPAGSWQTV